MTKNKDEKEQEVVDSFFYTFLGCLPMIVLSSACFYFLYADYERNNYSFMDKSKFYSNSNPNDFFENSAQIGDFSCARYFTDYVISEDEARDLLKFGEFSFNKMKEEEKIYLDDLKSNEEFKNLYK